MKNYKMISPGCCGREDFDEKMIGTIHYMSNIGPDYFLCGFASDEYLTIATVEKINCPVCIKMIKNIKKIKRNNYI